MQIAVIADDGEVIDTFDVGREDMRVALGPPGTHRAYVRSVLIDLLDTPVVRRFLGMPQKVGS